MVEGLDWQTILLISVAVLSLGNGLSVLYNFFTDRPRIVVEPVQGDDWMVWSEIIDTRHAEPIRRYIVVGHLALKNEGRRAISIADTTMKIRLRNLKTAESPLYAISQPEPDRSKATQRGFTVMKPVSDEYDRKPLIQPSEMIVGLHCFLYGMYGTEHWAPKTENDVLEGLIELTGGFGKTFKSKQTFEKVPFEELAQRFPNLEGFMVKNLEQDS